MGDNAPLNLAQPFRNNRILTIYLSKITSTAFSMLLRKSTCFEQKNLFRKPINFFDSAVN